MGLLWFGCAGEVSSLELHSWSQFLVCCISLPISPLLLWEQSSCKNMGIVFCKRSSHKVIKPSPHGQSQIITPSTQAHTMNFRSTADTGALILWSIFSIYSANSFLHIAISIELKSSEWTYFWASKESLELQEALACKRVHITRKSSSLNEWFGKNSSLHNFLTHVRCD